ncbi:hypothetical protein BGZ97_009378 [Linnemannia gamsii]|uniref:Uncharacterized protein n=1 Tax=Linnemannia gamsii TaxID=64522 RepID=A0A9P6QR36_9FUNG|nr:hypothetical protein BGZ97_009378 [Linnemannia gamsii]
MTATRSTHSTKRLANSSGPSADQSQQSQNAPEESAHSSPHPSLSGNLSEEECSENEADYSRYYSQNPLSTIGEYPEAERALSPETAQASVSAQATEPVQSSTALPINAATAETSRIHSDQLAAFVQQYQVLCERRKLVHEKLVECKSEQEHNLLMRTMQETQRQEHELRYMLEIRQAWDKYSSYYEQRMEFLISTAYPQPPPM